MTYVVKLDYATFAFGAGTIDLHDIESCLAGADLNFRQISAASENSPYQSPSGLFYKPNNGSPKTPHTLQVSGLGCELFRSTLPRLSEKMRDGSELGHFSRLDFAFDVLMSAQEWRKYYLGVITASVEEMNHPEKARKVRKFQYQGYGDATTIYIGRRQQSPIFCRIYNKTLADKNYQFVSPDGDAVVVPPDSYVIRYEIEFKYVFRTSGGKNSVFDPSPLFDSYYDDPALLFDYLRKTWNRYGNDTLLPEGWSDAEFVTDISARNIKVCRGYRIPLQGDIIVNVNHAIHSEDQKNAYVYDTFGRRIIDGLLYRPDLVIRACCDWESFYSESLPFSPLALVAQIASFAESSRIAAAEFVEIPESYESPFNPVGFDEINIFEERKLDNESSCGW